MEKKQINRRSFFSKSIQGMGAIAAMNTINPRYPAPTILTSTGKKGNIIYRTLGKTGLKMPIIGMGVMNANIPEIVAESYKQGVRHFDTAWFYQRGRNEEMVGDVIKTLGVRDDVSIATKIYIRDVSQGKTGEELKDIFLDRFHQSLKRLKTDYVDILYLHNVEYLAQIKVPEIKTALTKLKKEKKVRFVGFSTHANMTEVISEAIKSDLWEVILVAYNFTMWDDQNLYKTLQQAFNKGIGLVGMKTQTGGGWWRPANQTSAKAIGTLNQTAMLKWVQHRPFITTSIPGYTNFEHMEEDISVAYGLDYTPEEKKFLRDRNVKMSIAFCNQCKKCISTCPQNVDIPSLMRVHMYMYQYHNMEHAYATYQNINKKENLTSCQSCRLCMAQCEQQVPVKEKISAMKNLNLDAIV